MPYLPTFSNLMEASFYVQKPFRRALTGAHPPGRAFKTRMIRAEALTFTDDSNSVPALPASSPQSHEPRVTASGGTQALTLSLAAADAGPKADHDHRAGTVVTVPVAVMMIHANLMLRVARRDCDCSPAARYCPAGCRAPAFCPAETISRRGGAQASGTSGTLGHAI